MHPLEPLSAQEIRQAAAVLQREHGVGEGWRYRSIELREPPKNGSIGREALVVCWNRADGAAYAATVSLDQDR